MGFLLKEKALWWSKSSLVKEIPEFCSHKSVQLFQRGALVDVEVRQFEPEERLASYNADGSTDGQNSIRPKSQISI